MTSKSSSSAFVAGLVAGGAEVWLTMPFETTKNRVQMGRSTGFFDVLKTAGPRGLYYGVQAQMVQVCGKVAIRFTAFERLKRALPGSAFVAGLLAGCIEGAIWVAPTERLKMLRQAELGAAAHAHGGGVLQSLQLVLREQGAKGLLAGVRETVARNAMANGVRFGIFAKVDAAVTTFAGKFHAVVAGGITGVMSTVVTNPIDVLKTRVQSAPLDADGRAAAVTLRGLVEKEGPGGARARPRAARRQDRPRAGDHLWRVRRRPLAIAIGIFDKIQRNVGRMGIHLAAKRSSGWSRRRTRAPVAASHSQISTPRPCGGGAPRIWKKEGTVLRTQLGPSILIPPP